MKKYTKEFFKQILLKLTKINENTIGDGDYYHSFGDFILYYVQVGDLKYEIKSPRDYNGRTTDIFELIIRKSSSDFRNTEFEEQYILRGNNLIKLQILNISKEFKEKNIKYGGFFNPFPGKVSLEFEQRIQQEKRKVGLYVWWSMGKGDGDGRDSEMEVNEDQYRLLAEYNNEEIDEIDEPALNELLTEVYEKEMKSLKEDSEEFWEPYEEDQTFDDYWDNFNTGVRISHDFEDDL